MRGHGGGSVLRVGGWVGVRRQLMVGHGLCVCVDMAAAACCGLSVCAETRRQLRAGHGLCGGGIVLRVGVCAAAC